MHPTSPEGNHPIRRRETSDAPGEPRCSSPGSVTDSARTLIRARSCGAPVAAQAAVTCASMAGSTLAGDGGLRTMNQTRSTLNAQPAECVDVFGLDNADAPRADSLRQVIRGPDPSLALLDERRRRAAVGKVDGTRFGNDNASRPRQLPGAPGAVADWLPPLGTRPDFLDRAAAGAGAQRPVGVAQ